MTSSPFALRLPPGWLLVAATLGLFVLEAAVEPLGDGNDVKGWLAFAALLIAQIGIAEAVFGRTRLPPQRSPWQEVALGAPLMTAVGIAAFAVWASADADPKSAPALDIVFGAAVESLFACTLWIVGFRYPVAHARALEAERLQVLAELGELRARFQPHFVCNALNAIAAMLDREPDRSRALLADLGELLRTAADAAPVWPLREELAWSQRCAALLEARFDGDIKFDWTVSSAALETCVPSFVLQPLIENAIEHGLRPRGGGAVRIAAHRRGSDRLEVVIEDAAANSSDQPSRTVKDGLGLSLVRRRLALQPFFGRLDIETTPTGTRARIRLRCEKSAR